MSGSLWSILTESGTPMQEATLCLAHMYDADTCVADAESADDYWNSEWVNLSEETARNNDVSCSTCRALREVTA